MKRVLNRFLKSTSGHLTLNFFSALTSRPAPNKSVQDKDLYKLSDKELRDIGYVRGDLDEIN